MSTRRFIATGLVLIAVLVLVALIFSGPAKLKNWRETYKQDGVNPYELKVITRLLKGYFPDEKFKVIKDSLTASLPDTLEEPASFITIGEAMFLSENDVDRLLDFAEDGGHVFLSLKNVPINLMFYLYNDSCGDSLVWTQFEAQVDSAASLSLVHKELNSSQAKVRFAAMGVVTDYGWRYIRSDYFCAEEGWAILGYQNDSLANFARIPYGSGYFYLHSTPLAFTNYNMRRRATAEYAANVFSHLAPGPIYWDEYSKVPESFAQLRDSNRLSNKGPLQYIMSQRPLAWAWYLLLATALSYILFRGKRRQRIIPVLESNKNTSLEFVNTIGRLYFLQNNHRRLALQMLKLFANYVRERYGLQSRDMDAEFVAKLKVRSQVSPQVIDTIVLLNTNINSSNILTEKTLADLHGLLDQFYKNCK